MFCDQTQKIENFVFYMPFCPITKHSCGFTYCFFLGFCDESISICQLKCVGERISCPLRVLIVRSQIMTNSYES